jgi:hypothetical protein
MAMTPDDELTGPTNRDDLNFDPLPGLRWGFLLAACMWAFGLYFLWRCVTGEGL